MQMNSKFSFLLMTLGEMGRVTRPTLLARQLETLGQLTVLATSTLQDSWHTPQTEHAILPPRDRRLLTQIRRTKDLSLRRFEAEIWDRSLTSALGLLADRSFDCIFCEDITLLPLALALRDQPQNRGRTKVIMDAREYYPRQFENRLSWRLFLAGLNDYLCREYLPRADHVFTVSPGLREAYAKEYGVACELLPSCAPYHDIQPRATGDQVRLIHHGQASPGRKLEDMIEVAKLLDERFFLDIMLVPSNPAYYRKLQRLTANAPRVRIIPPVPMPQIVDLISQYDLGIFFLRPNTFNHMHCWPNKLFEFIQARLGIAISPLPDMARMVRQYDLGVVADDFSPASLAARLSALTAEEIDAFKANAHAAARELSRERCAGQIEHLVKRLCG